jgi:hypothetical protein
MILSLLYSSKSWIVLVVIGVHHTLEARIPKLTDMLDTFTTLDSGTKVPPHSSLKYLHHKAE